MSGGSLGLGIRSGSYGSLDNNSKQQQQQLLLLQNGSSLLPIQQTKKSAKMFKEKEGFAFWICKIVGRKKVGMLMLCAISAAFFFWNLYVAKGNGAQEGEQEHNIRLNETVNRPYVLPFRDPFKSFNIPSFSDKIENEEEDSMKSVDKVDTFDSTDNQITENKSMDELDVVGGNIFPPPPPSYFLGYTLPPGHPCNTFTLPPPPADKKRTGPRPCPVCYLPVEEAIALMPKVPSYSPIVKQLTYITEPELNRETEFGGSDFGGYPTLAQRNDSYDLRESMSLHCGFAKGRPGRGTGYDLDEEDILEMEQCRGIVVVSAIFRAFDDINQPTNISEHAKKTVCFYMFVDEETEVYLKENGFLDSSRKVGLWRIVVIHNPPYEDGRRTGKIPKLLPHRLFPNSRFSLWIDGKLELVVDPYQILERFLWRKNATFAISRHYKRFDVFAEAEANKAAKKYDNASIDFQIEFYKNEGLTPYTEAKLPITSDVPEGCVIIREHVPISNLFVCLWHNEVDRFTSRDQISFSTVRDKIRAQTNWTVNMFLDCERRNFVVQKYHRDHNVQPPPIPLTVEPPPPPALLDDLPRIMNLETSGETIVHTPMREVTSRRGRRRSSSRRHRKAVGVGKNTDFS